MPNVKLQLTVEVDGTEDHCEAVLEELDQIIMDGELVHITSAGQTHVEFCVVSVKEMPAVGRTRHDPHQLTIHDAIEED